MALFAILVALVLLSVALWTYDSFVPGKKRLEAALAAHTDGQELKKVEKLLEEPMWVQGIKYLALFAGIAMLWRSIYVISDLNVILLIATLILAVVYFADRATLRSTRRELQTQLKEQETEAGDSKGIIALAHETLVILAVILVLRAFIAEPNQIPSSSMKPTLDIGDFVLVWKLPYGIRMPGSRQELVDFGDPEVGDVIVFRPPHEPQTNYIKRVIAVPGDHVRYDFTRKRLYLNGELVPITGKETTSSDGLPVRRYEEELNGELHSTYVVQQNRRPSYAEIYSGAALQGFAETMIPEEGIVVPEGKYFAMGDNRDNSLDSRFWGFVEEDQISGKAVYIWLHWPSIFSIPSFKNFGSIQ